MSRTLRALCALALAGAALGAAGFTGEPSWERVPAAVAAADQGEPSWEVGGPFAAATADDGEPSWELTTAPASEGADA
ncbi:MULTISPECIES: hypothetical protein [Streptomyces]|uniref:hypothetical protein n=1 Tax=Streptomyces TaxID=1883 RepID=UPI0026A30187